MTEPGDILAHQVRAIASTMVPPDEVEKVSKVAAMVLISFMEQPRLVGQLRVVQELQQENYWLRNQLAIAQGALARYQPARKPAARKPAKKAPSKAQSAAFKRGVRDVRGKPR